MDTQDRPIPEAVGTEWTAPRASGLFRRLSARSVGFAPLYPPYELGAKIPAMPAQRRDSTSVSRSLPIELPHEELVAFCRRHRIRRLALFGSVLREDFSATSDLDVLVEFEAGTRMGLKFFTLQEELSRLLGRRVDLNTRGFLSRYFRDEVLAEAETIYDAA